MKCQLLSWELLVRLFDKELSFAEEQRAVAHLAECEDCRALCREVEAISLRLEEAVNGVAAEYPFDRGRLAARLGKRPAPERVMRRFGWGMAIAATLALGIIVMPKQKPAPRSEPAVAGQTAAAVTSAIEVDGETFIALPYSNPDLPASAPRIVQMQVPVSSLADIGIALEPVTNQVLNQDRSVLADVLLGADGQPLGVHVVSWE